MDCIWIVDENKRVLVAAIDDSKTDESDEKEATKKRSKTEGAKSLTRVSSFSIVPFKFR